MSSAMESLTLDVFGENKNWWFEVNAWQKFEINFDWKHVMITFAASNEDFHALIQTCAMMCRGLSENIQMS